MQVKAELVQRMSKKGLPYVAIEVSITDSIKKLVFLTQAEHELLKLSLSSSLPATNASK